jgi:hypothetical protein
MLSLKILCSSKIVGLTKIRSNLQLLPLPIVLKNQLFENAVELFDIYLQLYPSHVCPPHHNCEIWQEVMSIFNSSTALKDLWSLEALKNFRLRRNCDFIDKELHILYFERIMCNGQRLCETCWLAHPSTNTNGQSIYYHRQLPLKIVQDFKAYCSNCYRRTLFKIEHDYDG